MVIYYCITIIANIIAAIAFQKSINITGLSLIPSFLIALMFFQALIFRNEKVENGFRTAYGSNLTADEENKKLSNGSNFLLGIIPWLIPFILFFPSFIKVLSVFIYLIGLVGGLILYNIKNKKNISNRMNAEETDRQHQEKKEKSGKWK